MQRGSLFGLLGPTGAGKTTALLMAVGLLRPDAGSARIFGIDVWQQPVHAKTLIGVLPDGLAMPERLTGRELLTYLGLLLARIVYQATGAAMQSRLGMELVALLLALFLAVVSVGWFVLQPLIEQAGHLMTEGLPPAISTILRILPSGRGLVAVDDYEDILHDPENGCC